MAKLTVSELVKQAEALIKKKDLSGAIKHYEKAHNIDKDNADVIQKLNELYFKIGDMKKSKEYFLKLIKINPSAETDSEYRGEE